MALWGGNSLIILDRDGVINVDKDDYVKNADEWDPIPNSIEAIAKLSKAGFTIAVATNQSGIGRQYFNLAELEGMHAKMHQLVQQAGGCIQSVAFCPHLPDAGCDCRKPAPGLITQIETDLDLSAENALFVGDKLSDLQAAEQGNCRPVLVRTGKGKNTEIALGEKAGRYSVFDSLSEFTDVLLAETQKS